MRQRQNIPFYLIVRKTIVPLWFLLIAIVPCVFTSVYANEGLSDTTIASTVVEYDGPYIFLQNDSTYVILEVCDGVLSKRTLPFSDISPLCSSCSDSSRCVNIRTKYNIEENRFKGVTRILAVSDIHGEYTHFYSLLRNSEVIDTSGKWCWGNGHLVIVGDIFDRGDHVTECLWLLYRLEEEAKTAGGGVHIVLGNHEVMVLRGDNRYVNEKYLQHIVPLSGIAHQELYGSSSILGKWLRSKKSTLSINDILFVHGGLAPAILHDSRLTSLASMNTIIRSSIDLSREEVKGDSLARFMLGSQGPLWYRGYHEEKEGVNALCTQQQVDSILQSLEVHTIVVGHTEGSEVRPLYNGKVIAIDVAVEELGSLQGLLWENGSFYKLRGDGSIELIR